MRVADHVYIDRGKALNVIAYDFSRHITHIHLNTGNMLPSTHVSVECEGELVERSLRLHLLLHVVRNYSLSSP